MRAVAAEPTPIASPHQSGVTLMPAATPCSRMIGIIAAVNGMLSIAAERTAATHISTIVAIEQIALDERMDELPEPSQETRCARRRR